MSYNIQQPHIPNAEDKWSAAEHNGSLLIFFPVEVRRGIKTSNGEADAVRCARVVNLDTGRVLHDTLIFGTALVPNIGPAAPDGLVLARLGQGQGKNGNNPPWILLPHDEADLQRCHAWLAQDAQGQVAQPAPAPQQQNGWGAPPTPPAQGGWGQPAPAPAPAYGQPATGGWGNPPAQTPPPAQSGWGASQSAPTPDQGQFAGQWGNAAPAPATPQIDPGLVEALKARGVDPSVLQNQQHAESIAAGMGLTRG